MPEILLNNNPMFFKTFSNFYDFVIPVKMEAFFSFLLIRYPF